MRCAGRMVPGCGLALLVVACAFLAFTQSAAAERAVQLNCGIITYGEWDWGLAEDGGSRCRTMVKNVRANCGGTGINFIPTHFWVGLNDSRTVDYYCYKVDTDCIKVTDALIKKFEDGMTACIGDAVKAGFTRIEVTPHLDDGLSAGAWRNALVFEPETLYGGHSYYDIMLAPLARALGASIKTSTEVYFSMQGEMSATIMRYPEQWTKLAKALPTVVGATVPALAGSVSMGVSTNFNKLCACVLMDLLDPRTYVTLYPAAHAKVADQFNNTAIRELYEGLDFFGLASYPSMYTPFSPRDLENAMDQFAFEASFFGVNVTRLIYVLRKRSHFSEFGIGGGICQTGGCPAKTPADVAMFPFFGIFGPYSRATDPWQQFRPETVAVPTRDFLRTFYNRTVQWLANSGGPLYRVDALYMWNLASWDVTAIYPDSTSPEGSYRDRVVSSVIKSWNDEKAVPVLLAT